MQVETEALDQSVKPSHAANLDASKSGQEDRFLDFAKRHSAPVGRRTGRSCLTLRAKPTPKALSLACIVALTAAFVVAPFGHIHSSGEASGHVAAAHGGSVALHLHLAARSADSPFWNEVDESAQPLNAFILEKFDELNLQPALACGLLFEPPEQRKVFRNAESGARAPVNPGIRSIRLRGPPSLFS